MSDSKSVSDDPRLGGESPAPRDRKLCSAAEAVALIPSGAAIGCGGFVGAGHPESLTAALERRFLATGQPRELTLIYGAGQGDGQSRGLNHLAHPGLIKRVIGGHWGLAPALGRMALAGEIEAYNFPQGVICQLFRDAAAGRPGCFTSVGLGTFIDPEQRGGRLNERTPRGLVTRVTLDGQTWLWYRAQPIDVGLIRATAADPWGNLVMDDEAVIGEVLPIAQAAHNRRGLVLAQVKRLLPAAAPPHQVRVPGALVGRIVLAEPGEHSQTFAEEFNPAYCQPRSPQQPNSENQCAWPTPAGLQDSDSLIRRLVASRALRELRDGDVANLGIGMPEAIAQLAEEQGCLNRFTLTLESGPIGGRPAAGLSFGAAAYPQAIIDQPAQFDFYDGRGLDFAALGAAEIDSLGHVNVCKFGRRFAGVGGFVNISQSARRLVFCSSFTAAGLEVSVSGGRLNIEREGSIRKFVSHVELINFSASRSREIGQEVLYITERAVFRLGDEGLELISVTEGVDIRRDILGQMDFAPRISERLATLPADAG